MLTRKVGATIIGLLVGGALLVGVLGTATADRSQGWVTTGVQGNGFSAGQMMDGWGNTLGRIGGMMNQPGGGYAGSGGMMNGAGMMSNQDYGYNGSGEMMGGAGMMGSQNYGRNGSGRMMN